MSVLIKGMEIPKTCAMCWLSPICPVWVKEVSRYKGYDNRLPNCPLVEVPPPELIRCKDCIYYRQEIDICDEPYSTAHNVVHEDDYCSRAERKPISASPKNG